MWRTALEAAEYTILQWESSADRWMGRAARLAVGRYAAVLFLGLPVAWVLNHYRWGPPANWGLVCGVCLYAMIDLVKTVFRKPL